MKEPMEIKTGTDTERNYPRNRIGLHYLPECSAIFLWAIGATPWATRRDSWFGGMAPRFKIFGRLGEIKPGFAPPPLAKRKSGLAVARPLLPRIPEFGGGAALVLAFSQPVNNLSNVSKFLRFQNIQHICGIAFK